MAARMSAIFNWGGAHSARPPKIGKDMIFLRKMVIFHTKYPNNFRASLRSAQFFKVKIADILAAILNCEKTEYSESIACNISICRYFQ
jgi:CTP-dependent riboflavin kinase